MRIQHNISALNSYHKLATNNSNLAKNLEKLSSGYKINRAADDAAGLAISEKMRAQITGLETAQQNSKDGISLVQTAEGALTEVHSMLNRMVALTTQASNGIYEEGERTKIQDELDQLCEEIDRIADATNFNGIKLLDGSMTSNPTTSSENVAITVGAQATGGTGFTTQTVVHQKTATTGKTGFSVDLGNYKVKDAVVGDKVTIQIGADSFDITAVADNAIVGAGQIKVSDFSDTSKIAAALKTSMEAASGATNKASIGGQNFDITIEAGKENEVKFVQSADPTDPSEVVDADMEVTVGFTASTTVTAGTPTIGTATVAPALIDAGDGAGAGGTFAKFKMDLTGNSITAAGDGSTGAKVKFSIGSGVNANALEVEFNADTNLDAAAMAQQLNGKTITLKDNVGTGDVTFDIVANGAELIFTAQTNASGFNATAFAGNIVDMNITATAGTPATGTGVGQYQKSTTLQTQGALGGGGNWAAAEFTTTADYFADGNKLKIGNETYVFKTGADSKTKATGSEKLVDLSDLDPNDANFLDDATQRLTDAAVGNKVFTVGTQPGGKITLMETKENADGFDGNTKGAADLTSKAKIEEQLNLVKVTTTPATGKGLRLQIGDTDDDFNMLDVNVQDCHAAAIGVGKTTMRVDDVDKANDAMMAAKSAIENVSATRSKLGAIQNRLDHTLNNLAETTTNLTDAESRIRDTDMAEEMMKYTKNNILIQASQAMLAQANQVPQGVLQLLQ